MAAIRSGAAGLAVIARLFGNLRNAGWGQNTQQGLGGMEDGAARPDDTGRDHGEPPDPYLQEWEGTILERNAHIDRESPDATTWQPEPRVRSHWTDASPPRPRLRSLSNSVVRAPSQRTHPVARSRLAGYPPP